MDWNMPDGATQADADRWHNGWEPEPDEEPEPEPDEPDQELEETWAAMDAASGLHNRKPVQTETKAGNAKGVA